ncbi:MAG: hypothetical protein WB996_08495 [Ignavibacteriaceae bacterium]
MAARIKRHRSKAAKIAGATLFILLMFLNIQLTTNSNINGDIDLFGLKISFVTPSAYAMLPTVHKGPQLVYYCNGAYHYQCGASSGPCGINDSPCG